MTHLLFATALALSACAAYYSVMGLVAIFAAAFYPILIMGSLLEISKLVVASWIYQNWKEVPRLMRYYFTSALVILMVLTSMGIFGYLSKAHLDQAIPSGDVQSKLALIDEKIKTEKENVNASRKELTQLDAQVDQTISRTTEASGAERAIAIRKGQQKDRNRILNEIGTAQTKIAKYNEERAPIASEVRKVEAEVGPIKYIAALLYGDNPEVDVLEKAVRWVIIMIVIVFDPLAVLMLVAANWNMKQKKRKPEPNIEPDYGGMTSTDVRFQNVIQEVESAIPEAVLVEEAEPKSKWDQIFSKINFSKAEPLLEETKDVISKYFSKKQDDNPRTHTLDLEDNVEVEVKTEITTDVPGEPNRIIKQLS
jgi:hypothetical protein